MMDLTAGPYDHLISVREKRRRLLGIDGGTKTLGLALSDDLWMIASPLTTIRRTKFSVDVAALSDMVQSHGVGGLVIGLPINMDGSEGPRCHSARQLARNLSGHLDLPMVFWDERLSTAAVTRMMTGGDLSRKRRAVLVDKLAAGYILQGFLDYMGTCYPPVPPPSSGPCV